MDIKESVYNEDEKLEEIVEYKKSNEEEEKPRRKSKKKKTNTTECVIKMKKAKSYIIDFNGLNILIRTKGLLDIDLIGDTIEVEYESEIGKSDFKIYPKYK